MLTRPWKAAKAPNWQTGLCELFEKQWRNSIKYVPLSINLKWAKYNSMAMFDLKQMNLIFSAGKIINKATTAILWDRHYYKKECVSKSFSFLRHQDIESILRRDALLMWRAMSFISTLRLFIVISPFWNWFWIMVWRKKKKTHS